MSAFEKWWNISSATLTVSDSDEDLAKAAWNAALSHAEKICRDIDEGEDNFAACAAAYAIAQERDGEPT